MRRTLLALSSFMSLLAAPLSAATTETVPETAVDSEFCKGCEALVELALAHPARKDDRARDVYRHPAETLSFFRVRPDMKVGEYAPGGGWYSRVLAPYLAEEGHLTGLFFNPKTYPFDGEKVKAEAAAFPAKVAEWTGMHATNVSGMTLADIPEAEKGSFDRILVVRMMHNMMRWNIADSEIEAMRALLKDDGLLGIVQHRARADASYAYANGSHGYLREADLIKFMEVNGFELVGESEVNANPKDSADWEGGVWTLPPTYALKETDKARYEAIGESDRMTLLFRKRD
ncbi:class I SAM-dependent methyltransferase [Novosphingobium mangrovi (ex Huang et al. 2023)]|uniref:Methyltransferase n=1 Tax=Novosphingobium mangrovi (ex Huang et al. 2023) TaxID=2976432 RepID=A0ABT2IAQ7_9SPHN|nr:methyltransferase [Novosphingobium mangrovi (ex Huang et al. 2023)]MCT2401638.1 methyltransferase [Novosphingobium mangrovi (ex Huang et al. 2023)]